MDDSGRKQSPLITLDEGSVRDEPSSTGGGHTDGKQDQLVDKLMDMMLTMERNRQDSENRFFQFIQGQVSRSVSETTNFQVMPDFSKTIENFNGEVLGRSAMGWLERLESTALLHNWPDTFKLETAKTHLIGTAKDWFNGNAGIIKTFSDFKFKFGKTFNVRESKTQLWREMEKSVQGRKSLFSYFHYKVKLCKDLNLDFDEIKEQVVIGLANKQIIPGLLAAAHVDEDALLHDIHEFDRIHCQAQGRHFPGSYKTFSRNSNGFNEQDSSSSSAPERVGKQPEFLNTNPRIEEKETRKFTCYKCKGEGHLRRDCPSKNEPSDSGSKEKIIQSLINLEENCNNSIEKFIREIEIDRHLQVAALIDPGSAVCTIRESLVTSGQLISIDSSRKLFGFGQENPVNCQKKILPKIWMFC
ncbi:unnamed protein product [Phaedon cochleariae]|uniref:CCHC-type domain-containing protein n=1 Tax=Phaedon cochleariae TaxID=80249 RepID=A0A9N9X5G6_PHACE|nr:unnamed protein product [Phaedon cochleariae]